MAKRVEPQDAKKGVVQSQPGVPEAVEHSQSARNIKIIRTDKSADVPPTRLLGTRRPTMTDVARIAGVSQSSVSLVLNQMTGARISETTRTRVREAAAQIGYDPPGYRHQI